MTHAQQEPVFKTDHEKPFTPNNMGVKKNVLSNLGGIAVLLILVTVVLDVAARQFVGSGILGADTMVSDWWMVAVAMLGIVAAERSGAQIVVDIVGDRVSATAARHIALFAGSVISIFATVVAIVSLFEALTQMRLGEYAAVGDIPIWPARFLVPLGFSGLAVLAGARVIRIARRAEGPTL